MNTLVHKWTNKLSIRVMKKFHFTTLFQYEISTVCNLKYRYLQDRKSISFFFPMFYHDQIDDRRFLNLFMSCWFSLRIAQKSPWLLLLWLWGYSRFVIIRCSWGSLRIACLVGDLLPQTIILPFEKNLKQIHIYFYLKAISKDLQYCKYRNIDFTKRCCSILSQSELILISNPNVDWEGIRR